MNNREHIFYLKRIEGVDVLSVFKDRVKNSAKKYEVSDYVINLLDSDEDIDNIEESETNIMKGGRSTFPYNRFEEGINYMMGEDYKEIAEKKDEFNEKKSTYFDYLFQPYPKEEKVAETASPLPSSSSTNMFGDFFGKPRDKPLKEKAEEGEKEEKGDVEEKDEEEKDEKGDVEYVEEKEEEDEKDEEEEKEDVNESEIGNAAIMVNHDQPISDNIIIVKVTIANDTNMFIEKLIKRL
jgi:hypothetical protein